MTASPADPLVPTLARVAEVRRETGDTYTLTVRLPGPVPFAPGQFNMLYTFGAGEVPISISGDPACTEVAVHTVRAVGAVTRQLCRLAPDAVVGVRGPYGSGWPAAAAVNSDVVIVAGGIGLAPLRPLIYTILAARQHYGRVAVLYGARTPADLLYADELRAWRGRFDVDVHVTVDRADLGWHGHVGVVTSLFPRLRLDPGETVACVCGPEIMIRFAAQELLRLEVPEERIYVSLERNMKCAVGLCGRCQLGPEFVCRDGPVFRYDRVRRLLSVPGL